MPRKTNKDIATGDLSSNYKKNLETITTIINNLLKTTDPTTFDVPPEYNTFMNGVLGNRIETVREYTIGDFKISKSEEEIKIRTDLLGSALKINLDLLKYHVSSSPFKQQIKQQKTPTGNIEKEAQKKLQEIKITKENNAYQLIKSAGQNRSRKDDFVLQNNKTNNKPQPYPFYPINEVLKYNLVIIKLLTMNLNLDQKLFEKFLENVTQYLGNTPPQAWQAYIDSCNNLSPDLGIEITSTILDSGGTIETIRKATQSPKTTTTTAIPTDDSVREKAKQLENNKLESSTVVSTSSTTTTNTQPQQPPALPPQITNPVEAAITFQDQISEESTPSPDNNSVIKKADQSEISPTSSHSENHNPKSLTNILNTLNSDNQNSVEPVYLELSETNLAAARASGKSSITRVTIEILEDVEEDEIEAGDSDDDLNSQISISDSSTDSSSTSASEDGEHQLYRDTALDSDSDSDFEAEQPHIRVVSRHQSYPTFNQINSDQNAISIQQLTIKTFFRSEIVNKTSLDITPDKEIFTLTTTNDNTYQATILKEKIPELSSTSQTALDNVTKKEITDYFKNSVFDALKHAMKETNDKFTGSRLTHNHIGLIIKIASEVGGVGNKPEEFLEELNDQAHKQILGELDHQIFFKMAKVFSKAFQDKITSCGVLTGNQNATNLVGLRLKRISPSVAQEFAELPDHPSEAVSSAHANLAKQKMFTNPKANTLT